MKQKRITKAEKAVQRLRRDAMELYAKGDRLMKKASILEELITKEADDGRG